MVFRVRKSSLITFVLFFSLLIQDTLANSSRLTKSKSRYVKNEPRTKREREMANCTRENLLYQIGRACGVYKRSVPSIMPTKPDSVSVESYEDQNLKKGDTMFNHLEKGWGREAILKSIFTTKFGTNELMKGRAKRSSSVGRHDALIRKCCSETGCTPDDFYPNLTYCVYD